MKRITKSDRGSLALEQVLFIGAIVAMSVGLFAFYDNIASYFQSVDLSTLPNQVNTTDTTNSGTTTN